MNDHAGWTQDLKCVLCGSDDAAKPCAGLPEKSDIVAQEIIKDHNSIEAVAARSSQQGPLIMYLVVKESLNMSIGKTAAQCAHAAQMLMLKYFELESDARNNTPTVYHQLMTKEPLVLFDNWLNSSFRKVVLRANDKEFEKLKKELSPNTTVIVVDAGLTEIAAGTETVIGLFPIHKSQSPKCLKRLQVLK